MNMSPRPKTTIGQLLYPSAAPVNFERLVSDLDAALASCGAEERRTTLVGDRMAVIDAGASRVAVAMADGVDGGEGSAITVTVGFGPDEAGDARLARRQAVLARLIADRLAARTRPARMLWSSSLEIATPEMLARAASALSDRLADAAREEAAPARGRTVRPRHFVGPDDMPRLMAQFEATLDARRATWQETAARATGDDLPALDMDGLEGAADARPSSWTRYAAHVIDAALMVVLLPVGAAMMVWSLTRGADLRTSSRALVVTGVGSTLLQHGGILGLAFSRII